MAITLILSIGSDPDLMFTRSLVLQSAGYQVVTAYSIKEAANRIREGDFDLVLLCQSISTSDRDRLTTWVRASGSRIPIVSVSQEPYRVDAYTCASVKSEPAALLLGIRETLINSAPPPRRATITSQKMEVIDVPPKKPPVPSTGYRQQMETTDGCLLPLVRIG